jgi:hypothetical protein
MSVSAETTNAASKAILQTAFGAGVNALVADAIKSPVGALGGGIYGEVSSGLFEVGNKFLNLQDPAFSAATKTVAAVTSFFVSNAAAWAVLMAAGWKITFAHVIVLSLANIAAAIAVGLIVTCGVFAVAAAVSPRVHHIGPML